MSLNLSKCEPMTLYKDADGTLWRVVGYWTDPVVMMEEVCDANGNTPTIQNRLTAGIGGELWSGFRRLVEE